MKTIKIGFNANNIDNVAFLLESLDVRVIISYSQNGFLDSDYVTAVCRLSDNKANEIPAELQVEKIKEKNFIKVLNVKL